MRAGSVVGFGEHIMLCMYYSTMVWVQYSILEEWRGREEKHGWWRGGAVRACVRASA